MKTATLLLAAAALAATLASASLAQTAGTAVISGTLLDSATGSPARVDLVLYGYGGLQDGRHSIIAIRVAGQFPPRTSTDSAGRFAFPSLPEGTYVIAFARGSIGTDHWITVRQGAVSTPAIRVRRGQSLNLGTVRVVPQ